MKRILLFAICIVFSLAISVQSIAQTSISNIINNYSPIDSVYPTKDTLKVVDASNFNDGDTVMIYQVKGAVLELTPSVGNLHLFGRVKSTSTLNNTGKYEIIIVQKVLSENRIWLRTPLDKEYDNDQPMQIISVPSYKSASVDATLTCKAWDGSSGGILALMVSDTLFMNADINVTGKGFEGADPFEIEGVCANTDEILYKTYFFHENANTVSTGRKGEGFTLYDIAYSKGLGRWGNAGGGGNGRYSGGGGGGNYGPGGMGGSEDTTLCDPTYWRDVQFYGLGGDGGFGFTGTYGIQLIKDSVFIMGGGGGSGAHNASLTSIKGGNGGGIVILMVRNLKVSNKKICANGDSVTFVSSGSGAGGGGGGIVGFDVDNIVGDVSVDCKGGYGGNVEYKGKSGPGGGGGGGVVFWKTATKPANITDVNVNGGENGYMEEGSEGGNIRKGFDSEPGGPGTERNNYDVPLTGFLFNYVLDNQTVCWGDIPEKLNGSVPRGGDGTFIYKWEESIDNSSWNPADGTNNIIDYQPPALTDTIYYRRVVTSAAIADTSYSIKIEVQLAIDNNVITGDDLIICINNEGDTITGTTVEIGGDETSYDYNWQLRTDDGSWNTKAALEDTVFLPGIITDTSYVRRIVSSGACYDTTTNIEIIEIIGLPQISNNTLDPEQEICKGEVPALIEGSSISGGDGFPPTYQWQDRTNSSSWSDIFGANGKDYQPPSLIDTTYYKRFVYSDDCEDESNDHKVVVLPPIINDNIIDPSTPFNNCYGTQTDINASEPEGGRGSGTYIYKWEESTDAIGWSEIVVNSDNEDYQSEPLTLKIYFRRHVISGACESYTDTLEIDILDLPIATITEFEDTICSGEEVTLEFNLSLGQPPYDLTYSDGLDPYTENDLAGGPNNVIINPTTTNQQQIFNYSVSAVVDDYGCEAKDMTGLVTITAYGNPESNAGEDDEICSLEYNMKAVKSLGEGLWTQLSENGSTNFNDNSKPNAEILVDLAGPYTYKWKETNWNCVDSAEVDLILYRPVTELDAGSDTSLFFVDKFELNGFYKNPDKVVDTTSLWEIIQGYGIIDDPESSITNISDLVDDTREGIIVQWTVEKGVCVAQIDSLVIGLQEIFTPSGFTPNGDGINDFLKFNGLENAAEYEIIIYNRWGTEVFRKAGNSDDLEWDGKNAKGNDLPEDTYYYLLMVKNKNGTSDSHKGFIIIKRG
ncbi:MAG: gliding motility-associated C-terminal domain-containing protein [Bacteroidales bacterium]|nr:gliding motility-associated C-terminal domain-containing protein [Bacteroidales bacterium]